MQHAYLDPWYIPQRRALEAVWVRSNDLSMGWQKRENLNRKPSIFPWFLWDVPVIVPQKTNQLNMENGGLMGFYGGFMGFFMGSHLPLTPGTATAPPAYRREPVFLFTGRGLSELPSGFKHGMLEAMEHRNRMKYRWFSYRWTIKLHSFLRCSIETILCLMKPECKHQPDEVQNLDELGVKMWTAGSSVTVSAAAMLPEYRGKRQLHPGQGQL